MLNRVALATILAGNKLDGNPVESSSNLTASLRRFRYVQIVPVKETTLVPFVESSENANRDSAIFSVAVEICHSLARIDSLRHFRERATDEPFTPVGNVNGNAVRDRHSGEPSRLSLNVTYLNIP